MNIELVKDILLILGLTEITALVVFFIYLTLLIIVTEAKIESMEKHPIMTLIAGISLFILIIITFLLIIAGLIYMWMWGLGL